MKVTTDLRPGAEVEIEIVHGVSLAWVRLPDLTAQDEEELRRAHHHALREAFIAEGAARSDIHTRVVGPIEVELRRRGLEVDYRSMDHVQRPPAAAGARGDEAPGDLPMRRDWLPDLASLGEKELRRLHVRVMRASRGCTSGIANSRRRRASRVRAVVRLHPGRFAAAARVAPAVHRSGPPSGRRYRAHECDNVVKHGSCDLACRRKRDDS